MCEQSGSGSEDDAILSTLTGKSNFRLADHDGCVRLQPEPVKSDSHLCPTQSLTRSANAQMIHVCHTYRTSSQSYPLHNQPSQAFQLLQATLQQNDCTSSSFIANPVTLSEHQGHSNSNQTVEYSHAYHHTKFETY